MPSQITSVWRRWSLLWIWNVSIKNGIFSSVLMFFEALQFNDLEGNGRNDKVHKGTACWHGRVSTFHGGEKGIMQLLMQVVRFITNPGRSNEQIELEIEAKITHANSTLVTRFWSFEVLSIVHKVEISERYSLCSIQRFSCKLFVSKTQQCKCSKCWLTITKHVRDPNINVSSIASP